MSKKNISTISELSNTFEPFSDTSTDSSSLAELPEMYQSPTPLKAQAAAHEKPSYPSQQLKIPEHSRARSFLLKQVAVPSFESHVSSNRYEELKVSFGKVFQQFDMHVMYNFISFCRGRELHNLSHCSYGFYELVNQKSIWETLCRREWRVDHRIDTFIVGKRRRYLLPNADEVWKTSNGSIPRIGIGFDYKWKSVKETYRRHENGTIFIVLSNTNYATFANRELFRILHEGTVFEKKAKTSSTRNLYDEFIELGIDPAGTKEQLVKNLREYKQRINNSEHKFVKSCIKYQLRDMRRYYKQKKEMSEKKTPGMCVIFMVFLY